MEEEVKVTQKNQDDDNSFNSHFDNTYKMIEEIKIEIRNI